MWHDTFLHFLLCNKSKIKEKEKEKKRNINNDLAILPSHNIVWWKGFTAESDIWKGIENLENAKELVEEFEKEYGKKEREIRRQESYEERNEY